MSRTRLLGACALLVIAGQCRGGEQTAIVLTVTSALPPGSIDRVTFTITESRPGGRAYQASGEIAKRPFPQSVALVRESGMHGPFTVRIDGLRADAAVATAAPKGGRMDDEPLSFVPDQVVRRDYEFSPTVDGGVWDAGTSDGPLQGRDGAAMDAAVVDAVVPKPDGGTGGPADAAAPGGSPDGPAPSPPDAATPGLGGSPAKLDMGLPSPGQPIDMGGPPAPMPPPVRRDAGVAPDPCSGACACNQSCGGGGCLCANGCGCNLSCGYGSNCDGDCRGTGTRCTVNARGASNAKISCGERATCLIDARGPNTSNVDVSCGSNSACEVDCTGDVSNCWVACEGGAGCLLRCRSGANCAFKPCAGVMRTCGGGIFVCNRDCP